MSTMTKVFIVVNLVLSAIFLAASATLLGKSEEWMKKYDKERAEHQATRQDWTTKYGAKEKDLQLSDADKNKFMGERDRLDGEKKALENQLADQTKRNDALSSDVGKINANMDVLKTALKAKEDLAAKLQTQADEADKGRNEAVGKQNQAEEELTRVQVQLTEANEAIAKLQTEKKALTEENEKKDNALAYAEKQGINLRGILAMEPVNGKVQSVDSRMNFVILSVGEKDKVARGYTFDIHRGNQYIGRVKVDNVGADWSSATIEFTAPGRSIQVQDSASTRL